MNQEHRSILKRNRVEIIENIASPVDVSEALFTVGLFTDSMKQEVEVEKTKNNQVRKILDLVPKRGPEAFDKFYEALLLTNNGTVADMLKPELAATRPRDSGQIGYAAVPQETELPAIWPSESDMDQPVRVKPCDVRSELVTKYWQSADVYSMKKRKRGRCVIISNQTFKGPLKKDRYGIPRVILPVRHGTAKDVLGLTHLFEQFHFVVSLHEEKKAEEMDELLKSEARHPDHCDAECFILIICSHGTSRGIYGVDGKVITYEEVRAIFNSKNCPDLASKPKVIFLQSCHGEKLDVGGVSNSNVTDAEGFVGGEDEDIADVEKGLEQLGIGDGEGDGNLAAENYDMQDARRIDSVPSNSDMLVARATHPGYVSFRNQVYGSWFIQAVVWVFQRYAHERSLIDLLILVNRLVAKGRTRNRDGTQDLMQAALNETSFRKQFYFFPGVVASDQCS